jgi:hypothetical protein
MFRYVLTASAILLFSTQYLSAGFVISVQNTQLLAGGTGFVDVYITGEPGDTLGRFGYRFNITGENAQSGELQFRVTQFFSEQNIATPVPYVFLGDTDPSLITSILGDAGTNPQALEGGDALATLDDVEVAGTFLLARLEIQHSGPFSLASHNFTISLDLDSPLTLFDADWDPGTDNNYTAGQITAVSGFVTVNSQAVPEPTSLALVVVAGLGEWGRRIRRRKKQRIQHLAQTGCPNSPSTTHG